MADYQYLQIEYTGNGVARVTLYRPPANAVSTAMYAELENFFSNPDQVGEGLQAIVLCGAGKHFCAGNDLNEFTTMTPENGVERMRQVRHTFNAIQDCCVPTIAAVHGAVLGTGLCLAACCDFIVSTPDAKFGVPEITVGVMGAARHLGRLAPQALVRRMFFTGESLPASEFAALTGTVVLAEKYKLLDKATAYAERIASFSPVAVRTSKKILNDIENMDVQSGYKYEQGFTIKLSAHPDAKEAVAAFMEKRDPVYQPLDKSWLEEG